MQSEVADYWQILDHDQIAGVNLHELVEKYASPLYVYDENKIRENILKYINYPKPVSVKYAVKANSNLNILSIFADYDIGFDIVSQGELMRVLRAHGDPAKVIFSGVGKTDAEIAFSLDNNIGCFNVESLQELERISQIAQQKNIIAPVALRINPDVDAKTHPYISTGMRDNKFGIALIDAKNAYLHASKLKNISLVGISCHIGSQIVEISPFVQALNSLQQLAIDLRSHGIAINKLDIGGGLGVENEVDKNPPNVRDYLDALYAELADDFYLSVQPGRSIVANTAVLLTKVVCVKEQSGKKFVVVDAAMNDYARVAMYQAKISVKNLSRPNSGELVDIVGPICETTDTFARNIPLSAEVGDLLVIAGVGAYGMSMSNRYNSRLMAAEILLNGGNARLIRQRDNYDQLWENEII